MRALIIMLCAAPVAADWALEWKDTFDGDALNASWWTVYDNKTHGEQEWQLYTASQVSVDSGVLTLTTAAAPPNTIGPDGKRVYSFVSGWVSTNDKVEATFGRFEARIKLPVPLPSVWPAFWLVDDNHHCWPVGAEIDILEAVGGDRNNSIFGTYHWGATCGVDEWGPDGNRNGDVPHPPGANFSDSFHVFTAYWNRTAITWALDGAAYVSRVVGEPANLFVPTWPLFIILNTAMAYFGPGPQPPSTAGLPVAMLVDEVAIYSWAGPGGASGDFPIPYNATGLAPSGAEGVL